MSTAHFSSTIGDCAVAWSGAGVTCFSLQPNLLTAIAAAPASALAHGRSPAHPQPSTPALPTDIPLDLPPEIASLICRVRRHLCGDLQDFRDVHFAWETVTPFRQRVLRAVLTIAPGRTATYGEIAASIGASPAACRATGGAVGANPWLLLVPCHRILGANGRLTGYSGPGGLRTKARLLALEGVELPAA